MEALFALNIRKSYQPVPESRGPYSRLADYVTLVYHEARNVRHLIRDGLVEPGPWKYLIALDNKRENAWATLQPIRRAAQAGQDVPAVTSLFERRFRVSLAQLVELYGHPGWRNQAYGGNAWRAIAEMVRDLAVSLEAGQEPAADHLFQCLLDARHNTGSLSDKLSRLDSALQVPRVGDGV